MRPYRFATPAYRDLQAILEYFAESGSATGSRFLHRLDSRLRLLVRYPNMGVRREEFGYSHLRYIVLDSYLIAYDPAVSPLTIVAIRHAARAPESPEEDVLS